MTITQIPVTFCPPGSQLSLPTPPVEHLHTSGLKDLGGATLTVNGEWIPRG